MDKTKISLMAALGVMTGVALMTQVSAAPGDWIVSDAAQFDLQSGTKAYEALNKFLDSQVDGTPAAVSCGKLKLESGDDAWRCGVRFLRAMTQGEGKKALREGKQLQIVDVAD